jgi:hypothetical protein
MNQTKPKQHGGGYPPFQPTKIQRQLVVEMAGLKCSWEEMRRLIINPKTGKAIAKTSFARIFAAELEQARAKLKQIIASGYHAALAQHEPWALRLALKNVYNWSLETGVQPVAEFDEQKPRRIQVTFVPGPGPSALPAPTIDITPARSPDYQPGTRLPPPAASGPFSWMK